MLLWALGFSFLWLAIDSYLIWVPADGEKIRRLSGGPADLAIGLVSIEDRLNTLTGTFEGGGTIPKQDYKVIYTFLGNGQIKKTLISGTRPFERTREAQANFTVQGSTLTYTEIQPSDKELFPRDWEQFAILSDGSLYSMEWRTPLYSNQGSLEGSGADSDGQSIDQKRSRT